MGTEIKPEPVLQDTESSEKAQGAQRIRAGSLCSILQKPWNSKSLLNVFGDGGRGFGLMGQEVT